MKEKPHLFETVVEILEEDIMANNSPFDDQENQSDPRF